METQKSYTPIIIIATLLVLIGSGGTWFLYTERRSLMAEKAGLESKLADRVANIDKLKNEKKIIEQELAVLKASGLAKEVEILRLNLKNAEEKFAMVNTELAPLEETVAQIKLYADAVTVLDRNLAPQPPASVNSDLKNLGIKIGALNDSEISELWAQAKANIDAGGDGGSDVIRIFFLVISKFRQVLQ